MANMVVTTGVDAAGNLDLQLTDFSLTLWRTETSGDLLRDRDGACIGERAVVQAGTGNDIGDETGIGGCKACALERSIDRLQIGKCDMRQDDILLMADADFIEGIFCRDIRDNIHLPVGCIARNAADRLQRDRHHAVVGVLVWLDVLIHPPREVRVRLLPARKAFPAFRTVLQLRRRKVGGDRSDIRVGKFQFAVLQVNELRLDLPRQFFRTCFMHEDLDARLVLVVATTMKVVHAHDGGGVGQKVLFWQEVADFFGDHRRSSLPAADINRKADVALVVLFEMQTDIVNLNGGAIAFRTCYGNLELAWQEGEFRMHRRPLAQDFRIGAWISHFVCRSTCKVVGGDVANAISGGL